MKQAVFVAALAAMMCANPAFANAELAKSKKCLDCHAATKEGESPSFRSIAKLYKGTEKASLIEENRRRDAKMRRLLQIKENQRKQIIVRGRPEDEILKYSKKHHIDLIIMAKRRKVPGIRGMLRLGSVSRKILETSDKPVLILE